jgi:hypothetical protein
MYEVQTLRKVHTSVASLQMTLLTLESGLKIALDLD